MVGKKSIGELPSHVALLQVSLQVLLPQQAEVGGLRDDRADGHREDGVAVIVGRLLGLLHLLVVDDVNVAGLVVIVGVGGRRRGRPLVLTVGSRHNDRFDPIRSRRHVHRLLPKLKVVLSTTFTGLVNELTVENATNFLVIKSKTDQIWFVIIIFFTVT